MRRALLKEMYTDPAKFGNLPALEEDALNSTVAVKDPDYYIIETATPLSLSTVSTSNGEVVTLSWLCKSKSGDIYILCSNYVMDQKEIESEAINQIPFHNENLYISNLAVNDMIMNSFDKYLTDMNFSTTDRICDNRELTIIATSLLKDQPNKLYTFTVTNNLFASMSYVDNYICDTVVNNYEFSYAVMGGLLKEETPVLAIEFEQIFDLVAMAPVNKKDTSVVIVFTGKTTESERYTILVPFDIGVKFKKDKYRGMTVEKIEDTYMKDADQYLSIFTFNTTIDNIEKDFIIIKGKNKNDNNKLFFLDSNMRQNLIDRIKAF